MAIFVWYIIPLLLLIGALVLYKSTGLDHPLMAICFIIPIVMLFMSCFIGPVCYMDNLILLKKIEAVQITLDGAREKGKPLENLAITKQILEYNEELATMKFYVDVPILEFFVPEKVRTVDYIE